jgi:hypothetical protein
MSALTTITATQMAEFERLAQDARPITDADWGTERQIAAENAFFRAVGFEQDDDALGFEYSRFALKATTNEMLNEALRLLRLKVVGDTP